MVVSLTQVLPWVGLVCGIVGIGVVSDWVGLWYCWQRCSICGRGVVEWVYDIFSTGFHSEWFSYDIFGIAFVLERVGLQYLLCLGRVV